MPVEIKELVIRAVVGEPTGPGRDEERASERGTTDGGTPDSPGLDQQAIIEECVRQVLGILQRSRER